MAQHALPRIDEHEVVAGTDLETLYAAALRVLTATFTRLPARAVAAALAARPRTATTRVASSAGAALAGFRVVRLDAPHGIVLEGGHAFSRYAMVLRLEAVDGGSRCSLETRAAFPGVRGRVYRALVIGSGGHAAAVRRLLGQIRMTAEAAGSERPARHA